MIRKKLIVKRIYCNPEIYYGKGAISCLKSIEYNNFLILISQTIKNLSIYEKILGYFVEKSIKEEIVATTNQEQILKLKEKYKSSKPEVIVAIGGGKVLDFAKVLKLFLNNPMLGFSDLVENQFSENNFIKLIAVPTTPGTGSEANSIAVIKNNEGLKTPYINNGFVPDLAILDHSFLESIDLPALYAFGADIFAHGYEGQVSVASTGFLKALGQNCLALLEAGFESLRENFNDKSALANVQYAGYLGGIVQGNAYVGVCHALAHALEYQIDIPHGKSILILIKPIIEWTKEKLKKPVYDEILKCYNKIGFDEYVNRDILQKIDRKRWIEDALNDPSISTNPIRMKNENLMELVDWILM